MAESMLRVENLTKKYNGFTAVDHVSFEIKKGEVVGLVGPNGAGKTTIIHILLSLLNPDEGQVKIFGKNFAKNEDEILSKLNFAGPYSSLPYNLTPEENLLIFSLLYGFKDAKARSEALLEEFQLTKFRKRKSGSLSSGEQMRLSLAKAFLNNPKLLLLDEPTAFLDPSAAKEMRERICQKMKETNGAILWTSHNMKEIEKICDRILFLFKGKIITQGTPRELMEKFNKPDLEEVFIHLAGQNNKI
ncbi:MAG: ABC transporter ATP-binding protein [Candidatus Nealsonbacteria bacterium]|nr:ABC transporter ATP-binding protein [Candidatus Nealsonbacteria bacterium]